ncbi:hypothetical protein H4F18_04940 [Vibrio scophthalmi]|uniref:hypothetical protein n=1 Tax=Vibrio scophthalmi TaxID=45658 RepID=UPI002FF406E3
MNGDISFTTELEHMMLSGVNNMSPQQFEIIRTQLQSLSPQQLRALLGDINAKLDHPSESIISDDELDMITSLFS